jgi:hypothetical protein
VQQAGGDFVAEVDGRAERFCRWKRGVDAWVYELAGFWPDHAPDDSRFVWWEWFDAGLSGEQTAEAVVGVLTDEWVARYDRPDVGAVG